MKLSRYIIISIILHISALSVFLFNRGAVVYFGIRGGEITVQIGSGETGGSTGSSTDKKSLDDIRNGLKNGTGSESGTDDHGVGGAGGVYGAVGKLVNEAYRNNPPEYPAIARAMGYQGRVTLLLEVLPDGSCGTVNITKSSGYRVLDLAAQRAARGWIFFTENTIALSSPVRVSQDIIFMLKTY